MASEVKEQLVPIKQSLDSLVMRLVDAEDNNAVKGLIDEFRLMTLKKEMLRLIKLTEFSDLVDSEIGRRLRDNPERLKASELLEFSRLLQDSITRINTQMALFETTADTAEGAVNKPSVTIVQQNNFNLSDVKEREKVRLAADAIMRILRSPEEKEEEIHEAVVTEVADNVEQTEPENNTVEEKVSEPDESTESSGIIKLNSNPEEE